MCSNNLDLLLTMFIYLTFDIIINISGFMSTILLFDFCLFPQLFVPLFSFSFLLLGYFNTFISPFKFIYYVLTILVFHLFVLVVAQGIKVCFHFLLRINILPFQVGCSYLTTTQVPLLCPFFVVVDLYITPTYIENSIRKGYNILLSMDCVPNI